MLLLTILARENIIGTVQYEWRKWLRRLSSMRTYLWLMEQFISHQLAAKGDRCNQGSDKQNEWGKKKKKCVTHVCAGPNAIMHYHIYTYLLRDNKKAYSGFSYGRKLVCLQIRPTDAWNGLPNLSIGTLAWLIAKLTMVQEMHRDALNCVLNWMGSYIDKKTSKTVWYSPQFIGESVSNRLSLWNCNKQ